MDLTITITVPITLLLTGGFFMVKGNYKFFNLINDFTKKLPPNHKKAKVGAIPQGITQVNMTEMKTHIDTKDIDIFLKELETFNYNSIFFRKKEIISFSNNLQRHLRNDWQKFGIAIIQQLLEDEEWNRHKPYLLGYKLGKLMKF